MLLSLFFILIALDCFVSFKTSLMPNLTILSNTKRLKHKSKIANYCSEFPIESTAVENKKDIEKFLVEERTNNEIATELEIDDEHLIARLNREIMNEVGVELDQLINPSKVVNLERDVMNLEAKMKNGVSNDNELKTIKDSIKKKKAVLLVERRLVMRGWLKQLFVSQSVIATLISLGMVYNAIPGYDLPLPIQVLGFWMWWLFIIPSLRGLIFDI